MPWYTNPALTCKVLNRIANRYDHTALQDLKSALDRATALIWMKQENYIMTAACANPERINLIPGASRSIRREG